MVAGVTAAVEGIDVQAAFRLTVRILYADGGPVAGHSYPGFRAAGHSAVVGIPAPELGAVLVGPKAVIALGRVKVTSPSASVMPCANQTLRLSSRPPLWIDSISWKVHDLLECAAICRNQIQLEFSAYIGCKNQPFPIRRPG